MAPVSINGWVQSVRYQKHQTFLQINDGTDINGVQVVADPPPENDACPDNLSTGCAVTVHGTMVQSPSKRHFAPFEIKASEIVLVGGLDPDTYPLSKKNHPLEYLRTIPHLRCRTSSAAAVARVRNTSFMAFHQFFQTSDCEGAGEQFHVSVPSSNDTKDREGFFGQTNAYLTVSAQLHEEVFAAMNARYYFPSLRLALILHNCRGVYSFGPTFRAEKSHTHRHLAEFWMLEAELSFAC
jgi:asparaginyl-tRNA synthetase